MYGKRAKLGVIVPAVNYVMEPEFNQMMPWDRTDISLYTARMGGGGEIHGVDALEAMTNCADTAAKDLSHVSDVIAYGCTSGSFLNGPIWDAELISRLEEISGKPTTSTSMALVRGLRALGIRSIAIATPYAETINERMEAYFVQQNFDVVRIDGLGVTRRGGQGEYEPQASYDLAREVDQRDADAVVISCTNFRTIEVIERLEHELQKPVLTSNQATLWDLLRIKGISDPLPGYGQLLKFTQSAEFAALLQ